LGIGDKSSRVDFPSLARDQSPADSSPTYLKPDKTGELGACAPGPVTLPTALSARDGQIHCLSGTRGAVCHTDEPERVQRDCIVRILVGF